jgi:hypothetical protein
MRHVLAVIGAIVLGGLIVSLVMAVLAAQEDARQSACQGYMYSLAGAIQNYEAVHGHFPPAYVLGPDGKPWHSWRVLILPFLGCEAIYEKYRFDEPWNGPNNRKLADSLPIELLQCPSGSDLGKTLNTNFVVVVGDETIFPGSRSVTASEIEDGLENTILFVEVGESNIHWMEPRDLEFSSLVLELDPGASSSAEVSSPHTLGPGVVFANEKVVHRLGRDFSLDILRALLTRSGGERVGHAAVVR